MAIPSQQLPEYLMALMAQVEPGTTVLEVLSAFLISVLKRNEGNRTKTSAELSIPLRTFRHRIWMMESLGYEVPEPKILGAKSHALYLARKNKEKNGKKTKLTEF